MRGLIQFYFIAGSLGDKCSDNPEESSDFIECKELFSLVMHHIPPQWSNVNRITLTQYTPNALSIAQLLTLIVAVHVHVSTTKMFKCVHVNLDVSMGAPVPIIPVRPIQMCSFWAPGQKAGQWSPIRPVWRQAYVVLSMKKTPRSPTAVLSRGTTNCMSLAGMTIKGKYQKFTHAACIIMARFVSSSNLAHAPTLITSAFTFASMVTRNPLMSVTWHHRLVTPSPKSHQVNLTIDGRVSQLMMVFISLLHYLILVFLL